MDLVLFCTAFILQFVGHRAGDFWLQTAWQAFNKAANSRARARHCLVYSLAISLLLLIAFDWYVALLVFVITFFEHYIVDSGKFVRWWLTFQERKLAGNPKYEVEHTPFFVVVEYDQTVHYVRMFLISILLATVPW
ncbi:DUF3307 domain-containing protein [Paenibacillus sp.]|uniref:DUF3307 domain-containing protein n=1 Tax=Paenibacillus sp. TaxID=58172 RepID=UPI002D37B601|nr:DUF3307 domain-containing protein [Paenibacillus sp.]HZG57199.1 DUF3307 domain-containing protein [Paenibacillus sp.]